MFGHTFGHALVYTRGCLCSGEKVSCSFPPFSADFPRRFGKIWSLRCRCQAQSTWLCSCCCRHCRRRRCCCCIFELCHVIALSGHWAWLSQFEWLSMLSVHVVNLHLSQVRGISQPKTVTISNSPTPPGESSAPRYLGGLGCSGWGGLSDHLFNFRPKES